MFCLLLTIRVPVGAPTEAVGRPPKRKQEAVTDDAPKQPKAAGLRKRPKLEKRGIINRAPNQKLNVYVCGDVSAGEIGLGPDVKKVKRPRLNPNLLPDSIGVVQVATGGMHALALTHDNKILSWGVNDLGALGRNTDWEGRLVDIADADADAKSDDSDGGMNPLESTPTAIPEDSFPQNTIFTQVAAGGSASFAVTDGGRVYGWGTFRVSQLINARFPANKAQNNEGKSAFMFDKRGELVEEQRTPVLLPNLKNITQIACGADHALALDKSGRIHSWGNGQQSQLGRRVFERTKTATVVPSGVSIPKRAIAVGCGSYHSFAIDSDGSLWAWGLNSYGEAGIPISQDEEPRQIVHPPQRVESITGKKVKSVQGGAHHSVAVTTDGDCLVWGRTDGGQCGIDVRSLADENVVKDSRGNIRILSIPTAVPGKRHPYALPPWA